MIQKLTQWFFRHTRFSRRKEKIEITVETSETWGVNWFRLSRAELCPRCRTETIFIPPELGAQIVQADVGLIENLLQNREVHLADKQENEFLICLSSLKKAMGKTRAQKFLPEK